MVQEELMKAGHFKVAEAYILFRAAPRRRPRGRRRPTPTAPMAARRRPSRAR